MIEKKDIKIKINKKFLNSKKMKVTINNKRIFFYRMLRRIIIEFKRLKKYYVKEFSPYKTYNEFLLKTFSYKILNRLWIQHKRKKNFLLKRKKFLKRKQITSFIHLNKRIKSKRKLNLINLYKTVMNPTNCVNQNKKYFFSELSKIVALYKSFGIVILFDKDLYEKAKYFFSEENIYKSKSLTPSTNKNYIFSIVKLKQIILFINWLNNSKLIKLKKQYKFLNCGKEEKKFKLFIFYKLLFELLLNVLDPSPKQKNNIIKEPKNFLIENAVDFSRPLSEQIKKDVSYFLRFKKLKLKLKKNTKPRPVSSYKLSKNIRSSYIKRRNRRNLLKLKNRRLFKQAIMTAKGDSKVNYHVIHNIFFRRTRNNTFITVENPLFGYIFYSSGGLNYFYTIKKIILAYSIILGEEIGFSLFLRKVLYLNIIFKGRIQLNLMRYFIKGLKSTDVIICGLSNNSQIAYNGCYRLKKWRK